MDAETPANAPILALQAGTTPGPQSGTGAGHGSVKEHSIKDESLSLRQTLFLGAGLGILLPALLLAYFQVTSKFTHEVDLRVRVPMQQYADVLARGVAVAIWNVDKEVASELTDAVMRNPDVVSVTITDEYREVFVRKRSASVPDSGLLRDERDIVFNGKPVGHLTVELSSQRIQRELWADLFKSAAALAAQVLISFAFIWWLFDRRMMRPLKELQQGAMRLSRGELDQPLRWSRNDEIGRLTQDMEAMRIDLGVLIDERDKKNAALDFSRAKFAAFFDASPVALTVSRMDGSYTILDVNGAWVSLFGRSRASSLGVTGEATGMWRDLAVRRALLGILERDHKVSRYEAWMCRGDGRSDILCEISGQVIALGEESLLILAYEDVTTRHQYQSEILGLNATLEQRVHERTQELSGALDQLTLAQAELVRTEKMSALGSLVAGIAHELNTPIGNSLTVASTLEHQTQAFASEMVGGLTRSRLDEFVTNAREGTGILMRSLHTAAELVASFKQVAVDQTSAKRRAFRLDETIAEILLTLGPSIRKTSHMVELDVPPDIVMESFPGPLGQVLTNLINNALIHAFEGRRGGKVTISAECRGEDRVGLTVRDDGVGIPKAFLARVFDPFFTTKLGRGGSGLGLNIAYNLVANTLGGIITVESHPGQGAVFHLDLPRVAPDSTVEEA